jgi:transposase InsO family protein
MVVSQPHSGLPPPPVQPKQRLEGGVRNQALQRFALQLLDLGAPAVHHRQVGGNPQSRIPIHPSYAFVEQPQTNGVAKRFNRTLKEQIIHGRIYRNIDELRDAVRVFVERYNAQWLIEKNGYPSPDQARHAWYETDPLRPAA